MKQLVNGNNSQTEFGERIRFVPTAVGVFHKLGSRPCSVIVTLQNEDVPFLKTKRA